MKILTITQKKVKTIETCVLFIDIRKSTAISLKNDAIKMTKLYSSFSRSMIKIAEKNRWKG
jgi:adenylate cyclase